MNTDRDLNYRLYIQKMNGFTRIAFHSEFEKYKVIQAGNVEQVRRNFAATRKDFLSGKGQLSDDPVRNVMYHFVVAAAMACRVCVEGGMGHDAAYTLSDIYIRKADKCTTCEALIDLLEEMQVDFAERMREIRKSNAVSIHIRRCIDYIYENLHRDLSVKVLAELQNLNSTYLSKLFVKETGVTIKDFVTHARIATAENMLKYSDFSFLDIALSLGFSSQSAFISVFRKITGLTPKKYRDKYCNNNMAAFHTGEDET